MGLGNCRRHVVLVKKEGEGGERQADKKKGRGEVLGGE